MVKQGDIIKIDLNPQLGSEQAGYRPAIVISNDRLNHFSKVILACPITNTPRTYPSHIRLPQGMLTTGEIMCEQIKALDLSVRNYRYVESVPTDILEEVCETLHYITEFVP